MQQLKSGLKRTVNWNKYQLKVTIEIPNEYLDYLIDPVFQGVNRTFVLRFDDNEHRTQNTGYFSSKSRNKRLQCYG